MIIFDIITLYESKKEKENSAYIWNCLCNCYDFCNVRIFVVATFVNIIK